MNCVETETHSPCKKHLQKSFSVIESTSMQESWQTHQADPRGVSDLIEVEVKPVPNGITSTTCVKDEKVTVCDICGDAGQEKSLAICNKCGDGAEHIYCMRVKLNKVPEGDWMCEECMVRSKCQKSESPVNLESWNSSELKFKSSHAWKRQTEGSSKTADLKFKGQLAEGGGSQKRKVERNLASDETRKRKNLARVSESVSFNSISSEKLNATCSEDILENAYHPVVFKKSSSAEKTVAGSNCGRLDAVQSCGHLDCRLQPKSPNAHKDLNCLNEEKENESWQAERPNEAAIAMELHKLYSGLGSDERSQFEAAIHSEKIVMPKPDYIWLGKFQLHRSEGIPTVHFGIQAHLSIYALQKVLAVVYRLPKLVLLEELPRLSIWSSQFFESQATEENIALYFFVKDRFRYGRYYRPLVEYLKKYDLALKGNLDGVELLIFPSNVLLDNSQCSINSLFLWGEFGGQDVNNSPNTPVSNSQRLENRGILSSGALDLDAYLADGNGMVGVDEVGKYDSTGTSSSGVRIWLGGDSYNAGCSDSSGFLDGGKKKSEPKSATPKDGPWLPAGNVGDKTSKDVRGKLSMVEENDADNVEVQGKLPMKENNNADNVELSSPPSPSLVSPTTGEEDMDLLDWLGAVTLFALSKGLRKI